MAGKDEEDLPKFKTGMTPLELRELFVASLSAAKAQSVKVTQLKPAKFGKLSGFRFAYNYLTSAIIFEIRSGVFSSRWLFFELLWS